MSTNSPTVLQAAFDTSMIPPSPPETGHSKVDVADSAPTLGARWRELKLTERANG